MKKNQPWCFLLFILCFNSLFSQSPNVVVIIADDMGWSQVSTPLTNLNNPSDFYETPVLATLASEGIAFPHGYVNGANCAPTRAALLSGQYAARPTNNIFNVYDLNRGNTSSNSTLIGPDMGLASNNNIDEIPASAITIAETMKTAGYTTAHWGKYHVGEDESSNTSNNAPTDQGFDYNYGGGTSGAPGTYFASSNAPYTFSSNIGPELDPYASPYTAAESLMLAGDNSLTGTPKHITDAMADAAIDFMEAEKNTPFFMHFSNFAIHSPTSQANARPDLYAKYVAKNNTNPSSMGHNNLGIAAILEGMDQSIGRLIDYLKTTADPRNPGHMLSENTLVYFISDNGGAENTQENGPLKGMKGEYTEGGIRSVTVAWSEAPWLANKGTVNTTPIIAFDLYPTLAEMAGASLPGGYDIDGASQWQMLTNGTSMTRESIFWHFPGYLIDSKRDSRPTSIIRKGDYKLRYNYETLSYEMYNLISDMSETTNLLSGNPDSATLIIANDMSTLLRNHLIDTSAPLPTYRSDGTTCPLPYIIDVNGGGPNSTDGCQAVNGYEAYWNFDVANGANDASGNSHDAYATVGTITYDGSDLIQGDQSAVFNGSSSIQYAQSGIGTFMMNALSARTMMAWVKPTNLAGIQNIYDEGGGTIGIAMRLNGSNLETVVRDSGTTAIEISAAFPNDGGWHHVALVYDGANTSQKLYIDGVEVATGSAASSIGVHTGKGGIGGKISGNDSFKNSSDAFFTGKMDAFAVYETAMTLADVETSACLSQVVADAGPDVTICEGDSATLSASGGTSYLWSTGATTASISVSPTVTTTYTVTVFDGGDSDQDDVIVTVNPLPIAAAGEDVTICEGDSTTLTASGGDTYLWSTGATTASINVTPSSTTTYSVTTTQNGCTSVSDDVIVTVNSIPVADAGADVSICEGDSTTLTASGGDTYLWSTGATTSSINVSPTSTSTYTVTASSNGCSSNDDVEVTVNAAPSANAGSDVSICEGDSTTLTASGGGTYLWNTGASTASIIVSPSATTTYSVAVTSNGCSSNDDVIVTVNSAPIADAGSDVTICDGDSTTLTASGGDTYLWSTGATTSSISVSPSSTTVYSVTASYSGCGVSDNDDVTVTVNPIPIANAGVDVTICEGDTTSLTASGGDTYLWSTGATTASISVNPTSTTTYTVTVTTNGCSTNDDVIVNVNPLPSANAGSDVSICEGSSTILSASGGDTYLWNTGATTASISVNPTSTTTYTVTATSNGCSSNDDVLVTVNTIPIANAGVDATICNGDSTLLTASGGDTYLWSTGATTASINVSPSSTTTYSVIVTLNGCDSSSDDVIVTVHSKPTANAGADVTITEGDSTTLSASGGGAYLWSTGATTASISVSPNVTTTYSVTVTQNGCTDVDDVVVTVESGGCTYSVLNSEGFESGWGIWNGGGSDASRSSNDAIYATTGTYCISLRDNSSTSVVTTNNLDLTAYEEITIDFGYYPRSMDNSSEDFWLQISTNGGGSFTTVEEWNLNDEFVNDQFYTDQVIISGPFTSNTQLRFRADASGNSDWVYIDDVVISGCSNSGSSKIASNKGAGNFLSINNELVSNELVSNELTTTLFPNPFNDQINIKIEETYINAEVRVLNILGQSLYFKSYENIETIQIPTHNFQAGQYLIRMDIDGKTIYKRAIKKQ